MGRDPKPTPLSRVIESALEHERRARVSAELRHEQVARPAPVGETVAEALLALLTRCDGWLRITPQDDGRVVYWKFKWTGGKHVNHYVMAVYPASQSADAILALARKVDAVDRGEKAPVKDHYFQR